MFASLCIGQISHLQHKVNDRHIEVDSSEFDVLFSFCSLFLHRSTDMGSCLVWGLALLVGLTVTMCQAADGPGAPVVQPDNYLDYATMKVG